MITCKKNDRLLELLWFVGYSIEFPTQLAVRIGGGAEWNRRVMYRAIQEGYVRLYRKQYKRHVIRSMSLTRKGYEYIAQRDPEALAMIYSRVNSSERVFPGWTDKILRLHAIAIGTVMSHAAEAIIPISQKPSLMSPAMRATNAVPPDPTQIYYYASHELRVAIEEYSPESVSKGSRSIGIIVKGRCCYILYFTGTKTSLPPYLLMAPVGHILRRERRIAFIVPLCQQVSLFMPGAEIVQRRMDRRSPPAESLSACNTGGWIFCS